jgi:rhamnogalacturonyl hydrolase YesR
MQSLVKNILKLDQWIGKNGFSGYDPYDIKALPLVIKITKLGNSNKVFEMFREIIFEIFYSFPVLSRKILLVKPQVNPKSMALFSSAYLDLYKVLNDKKYLDTSIKCLDWLIKNQSKHSPGMGWGYPFNWQTSQLIPAYTPNGVVTTAAGDAFWKWYAHTNDQRFLDSCIKICDFLVTLPIDQICENQICFSYTPVFKNHVHNLNLFVAEFLIKIGKEIDNYQWIKLGNQAVNYTIANQRTDGSFDYNGPPEKLKNFSDNYHTGFVLRMLHSVWRLTGENNVFVSLEKCYNHYINNFFENAEIPKLLPNRKYRVDIHSCAESINCLSELSKTFPQGIKIAENVAKWTIENLQDESGYFYYGFLKSRFTRKPFLSKIAYLRWGQSWMLKALSNLLLYKQ